MIVTRGLASATLPIDERKIDGGWKVGTPPTLTICLGYATFRRRVRYDISAFTHNLGRTIIIVRVLIPKYICHPPQTYLKIPLPTLGVGIPSACEPSSTTNYNHAINQCATHKVWRPNPPSFDFGLPQYEVISIAHAGHPCTLFTCFP